MCFEDVFLTYYDTIFPFKFIVEIYELYDTFQAALETVWENTQYKYILADQH